MTAPWDRLRAYAPTLLNAAGQAWERVANWRRSAMERIAREAPKVATPPTAEPRPVTGALDLEQLTEAVAAQSELAKQLAEQADGLTHALSNLAERINRLEEQNKQQIARMRAEVAGQAARSRWAMTIAGLAIVLAGLLAVLPYLARYF